jgi:hypothetical protein
MEDVPHSLSGIEFASWWESPSGLMLPCSLQGSELGPQGSVPPIQSLLVAERRDPMPGYVAYATLEAMGIQPLDLDGVQARLEGLPIVAALAALSDLQSRLWSIGMAVDKHLELAAFIFGRDSGLLRRLRRFTQSGEGGRVVFCEQAFLLLQWMMLAYSSESDDAEMDAEKIGWLQQCLLSAPTYLGLEVRAKKDVASSERWLPHLTQNLAFNAHPVIGNAMARTWKIFGHLYRSSAIPDDARLDDWFRNDYGLDLEQQLTLSFAVHAHLNAGEDDEDRYATVLKRSTLEDIYDRMGLEEPERVKADELLSASRDWFRSHLDGKTLSQLSWDQVPFMQKPFIRVNEETYLLQSPRALQSWMVDGPYYRGLDSARRRGPAAVSAYTRYVGELTERYVVEIVKSIHPEPRLPSIGKVYGDKQYGNGAHSSDVTITYPSEVVLMEVASHRLTLEAKRDGDPEAIRRDLTEMLGRRPPQLKRCIDAIKPLGQSAAPTLSFERLDPRKIARFWPLVVTSAPLRWTGALEEFLGANSSLGRSDVELVEVIAIEDLELLLAISEETGLGFSNLLARKSSAVGPHGDIRWWVQRDRSLPRVARPRYLNQALDEVLDLTTEMLGFDAAQIRREEQEAA